MNKVQIGMIEACELCDKFCVAMPQNNQSITLPAGEIISRAENSFFIEA